MTTLAQSEIRPVPAKATSPPARPVWTHSLFLAALLAFAVSAGFAALSDAFWHWFIIPVLICGILMGVDALDWIRRRVDIFDPAGIVGLFGLHFFFFAPLLHVYRNYWMPEVAPPPDWRDWLGAMALLNAVGLAVYRLARTFFTRSKQSPARRSSWQIDERRFWILVTLALGVSALLQVWAYAQYGGIVGYITAVVDPNGIAAAQGMGWLFTLAESFPAFAIIAWAVFARNKGFARSWLVIVLVLAAFFVLKLMFGGLRGSRSNTIWGLLSALGIIHFYIRPLPRKFFLICAALLLGFMYVYGFFKAAGLDGLQALGDVEARDELIAQTGRNLDYVILGDLGRSDVQAFVLYRLSLPDSDYSYAWGRTYLGGVISIIPSALWPDRPPGKVKEGTEVLYGAGTFSANEFWSSRQYGLAGEAMLNFGPLAVPFAFLILAYLVSRVKRAWLVLSHHDARWFLVPTLSIFCFILVATDSDSMVLILLKELAIPFALLLSSVRVTRLDPIASA
jgi:hypothetical protein